MSYDSRPDTYEHIGEVRRLLLDAAGDLLRRAHEHDQSKLVDPELSMFNIYRPKLDEVEHDSPEYHEHLAKMGEALQHHYEHNSHHPEHYENGVQGMTLLDLLEMLCDWIAASGRKGDPLEPYITDGARKRFGYGDEIERLLLNTLNGPLRRI